MVSKASEDLPEPERPVKTIIASRGRSRSTLRRLCSRAPFTTSRDRSGRASSMPDEAGLDGLGPADFPDFTGTAAGWTSTAGSSATALGTPPMLIENFFEYPFGLLLCYWRLCYWRSYAAARSWTASAKLAPWALAAAANSAAAALSEPQASSRAHTTVPFLPRVATTPAASSSL